MVWFWLLLLARFRQPWHIFLFFSLFKLPSSILQREREKRDKEMQENRSQQKLDIWGPSHSDVIAFKKTPLLVADTDQGTLLMTVTLPFPSVFLNWAPAQSRRHMKQWPSTLKACAYSRSKHVQKKRLSYRIYELTPLHVHTWSRMCWKRVQTHFS